MFQDLQKMREPGASLLLLFLLSTDFVFIVLHIIIGIFNPNPSLCNISGICAYMNGYHLVKLFWVTISFAYIIKTTGYFCYIPWLLMFTFFVFDDALLLHQKAGDLVSNIFHAYFPNDFILSTRFLELAILAIVGMVLLVSVAWAYSQGSVSFRKTTIDMLLFIAALIFFGLIVDLAGVIKLSPRIVFGLEFIEDGGEQVVDSLILWYVFLLAMRNGKPELFLHELLLKSKNE